jgi:hypothetical protein
MRPVKVLVKETGDVLVLVSTGLALLLEGPASAAELEVSAGAAVELEVISGAAELDEVHDRDQVPEVLEDVSTGDADVVDAAVPDIVAFVHVEFQDAVVMEMVGLPVERADDDAGAAVAVADAETLG